MKIILSHEVDHLFWSEHLFRDSFIPKLLVRSFFQVTRSQISFKTALARCNFLAENRMNRLNELTDFLQKNQIRSTFFIGFANGLNLSYNQTKALETGEMLLKKGFAVGVHGIAYNQLEAVKQEKQKAQVLLDSQANAGIRMHYLRYSQNTHELLSNVKYQFDSTEYQIKDPYLAKPELWSFPISIMDTYAVKPNAQNLNWAKNYSLLLLQEANNKKLKYFTINFHDVYFNEKAYAIYKDWLLWFIDYLINEGYTFTDFDSAILELKSRTNN